jgi:hypothetical protein
MVKGTAEPIVTATSSRGLGRATAPYEKDEVEVDVDGIYDLAKLVHLPGGRRAGRGLPPT